MVAVLAGVMMTDRAECFDCGAKFNLGNWSIDHVPNCPQAPQKRRKIDPGVSGAVSDNRSGQKSDRKHVFLENWKIIYPDLYRQNILQPIHDPEHKFALSVGRKHRFDFAWLSQMVYVEIDGGNRLAHILDDGRAVAVGRHTQQADFIKRNLAVSLGWVGFHFLPEMLTEDPVNCCKMVYNLLQDRS